MINLFNYIERPSPIHKLTGASKLIALLMFSVSTMTSFYTPFLAVVAVIALVLFRVSKIRLREVSFLVGAVTVFMLMNNVLIFLFSPEHGVSLYGSRHVLLSFGGRYAVTQEQLFYHLNLLLKYLCTIPVVILFVCTTNPSEFAASLNRIGVSYRISYAVALALRYIPDIQREYRDISRAQQARGVEMSKKATLIKRLKAASAILIPLVLSSLERIEVVSNAMELRRFGKAKQRTWYAGRDFTKWDYLTIAFSVLLMAVSMLLTFLNGSRFYNPFAS
ncbi:MAG: energy-coupling factor transporter transmembrane protein EcfT [Clostridiales bacterium]|nr:energy-coupling factor transporter transmembrane protein EcfT [Clostridiales bacterium]